MINSSVNSPTDPLTEHKHWALVKSYLTVVVMRDEVVACEAIIGPAWPVKVRKVKKVPKFRSREEQ